MLKTQVADLHAFLGQGLQECRGGSIYVSGVPGTGIYALCQISVFYTLNMQLSNLADCESCMRGRKRKANQNYAFQPELREAHGYSKLPFGLSQYKERKRGGGPSSMMSIDDITFAL